MKSSSARLMADVKAGTITRREFLVRSAALGLSLSALESLLAACAQPAPTPTPKPAAPQAAPTAAPTERTVVLRYGMGWTNDLPGYKAAVQMAQSVRDKSNGSITIQVFPNSQLGTMPEEIEAVKVGAQEMWADVVEWFGPLVKDYSIFGAAFVFRDLDHVAKVVASPIGQGMADQMLSQHGIRVLDQSSLEPPRQLLSKKPVQTVADIQGVKMRVPQIPTYFSVWKAIGANPTPIPWADLYTALQGGVVDAMEGPVADIYGSKFGEVAKNMAMTNHLVSTSVIIVNEKFFQSLSPNQQKILTEGVKQAAKTRDDLMKDYLKTSMDGLKAQGVQINEKVDVTGFLGKAKSAISDLEKQGTWSAGLYDKIQAVK